MQPASKPRYDDSTTGTPAEPAGHPLFEPPVVQRREARPCASPVSNRRAVRNHGRRLRRVDFCEIAGSSTRRRAVAAVVGTRFLLSEESHAHPEYKKRCLNARDTVLTELFGLGWPDAPHRVIPNDATRRWLRRGDRGPLWIRAGNRITTRLANLMPLDAQNRAIRAQLPSLPFLMAQPPTDDAPAKVVDARPLYAGANVGRIADIRKAADLVKLLTP
jgi:nitronate monooxygenase